MQAALLQSVSRWPPCYVALVVLHGSYLALIVTSPPPECLSYRLAWLGWPWVADGLMHKELAEALVPAASQLRGAGSPHGRP